MDSIILFKVDSSSISLFDIIFFIKLTTTSVSNVGANNIFLEKAMSLLNYFSSTLLFISIVFIRKLDFIL